MLEDTALNSNNQKQPNLCVRYNMLFVRTIPGTFHTAILQGVLLFS